MARYSDFKVVGQPFSEGRLIQPDATRGRPTDTPRVEPKQVQPKDVLKLAHDVLFSEVHVETPVDGLDNIPFPKQKKLSYLKAVETYLLVQLKAVQEAKQKLLEDK